MFFAADRREGRGSSVRLDLPDAICLALATTTEIAIPLLLSHSRRTNERIAAGYIPVGIAKSSQSCARKSAGYDLRRFIPDRYTIVQSLPRESDDGPEWRTLPPPAPLSPQPRRYIKAPYPSAWHDNDFIRGSAEERPWKTGIDRFLSFVSPREPCKYWTESTRLLKALPPPSSSVSLSRLFRSYVSARGWGEMKSKDRRRGMKD